MKRVFLFITITVTMSVMLVLFVFFYSQTSRGGGMIRYFPSHIVGIKSIQSIGKDCYYLAGVAGDSVFIGDFHNPKTLYLYHHSVLDSIILPISPTQRITKASTLTVEFPTIYLHDILWGNVLTGQIHQASFTQYHLASSLMFQSVPLSYQNYLLLDFDTLTKTNRLEKVLIQEGQRSIHSQFPLDKQVDGYFCTQGALAVDTDRGEVYFVYQYRNELLRLDTSLYLLQRSHTIDTVRQIDFTVDTVFEGEIARTTFSSPPQLVNSKLRTYGSYLFISSGIQADNQSIDNFEKAMTIDRKTDLKYQFSFYLTDLFGQRIRDFLIEGDRIIGLAGTDLIVYELDLSQVSYPE